MSQILLTAQGSKSTKRKRSSDVGSVTVYIWQHTEECCKYNISALILRDIFCADEKKLFVQFSK